MLSKNGRGRLVLNEELQFLDSFHANFKRELKSTHLCFNGNIKKYEN